MLKKAIKNPVGYLAILASTNCFLTLSAGAQMPGQKAPTPPAAKISQTATGMRAMIGEEEMRVEVCADVVIHVSTRAAQGLADLQQPWLLPAAQSCKGAPFHFSLDGEKAELKTGVITVQLSVAHGNLTFATNDGKSVLKEGSTVPRTYAPESLNGESTYRVVDRFSPDGTEAMYGLGQHQNGLFNYRGATVALAQNNTDIAVPVLLSSKGYGLIWNTASLTYVDNRFPLELKFDTLSGPGVDYFFLYGPEPDSIIHHYRDLTGHSPLLPRWAYGFIQSKDRYTSLDEIQQIAKRYRDEHIPIDVMVQDWFWWKTEGDPIFNNNYHDVASDLRKLHDKHFHTMISTWGLLDPASATFQKMDARGLLVTDAHVYDSSSAEGRSMYWENLPGKLFAQGWDSFWLDSAEPEEYYPHMGDAILQTRKIAIGNGATYTNVFPLLHNEGIQESWRKTTDQKRTFLLTRSSFLGQQRVGATVWSGDVYSSWWGLKHQIAGGMNYALSGLPYWTTDIGGYWPTFEGQLDKPEYQELYLRWFQFGAFCPVFRSHGHRPHNEMWTYPAVESSLIAFDKFRYRMMPYVYSTAWMVSHQDYTMQRPLVMDFRSDQMTWDIGDQFLFGPSLLVNPVMEPGAVTRRVYLPKDTRWYDFWTGESLTGGKYIQAAAPLDRLPLYVRAGSILPLGPEEEYADEHPNGPIELRIYPGADGRFQIYNDQGDNYGYEKGQFSLIPVTYDDATHEVTFGERQGSYPAMPQQLTFHVTLVKPGHGVGPAVDSHGDQTLRYEGKQATVKLR